MVYAGPPQDKKKADKRLSVERIYQKKSQLEHILLRPDTYIGSVQVKLVSRIEDQDLNIFLIHLRPDRD